MKFILINLGSSDPIRMWKGLTSYSLVTLIFFQLLGISSQGNPLSPLINLFFRITLENTPLSELTGMLAILITGILFVMKTIVFLPMILYILLKFSDGLTNLIWGKLRL